MGRLAQVAEEMTKSTERLWLQLLGGGCVGWAVAVGLSASCRPTREWFMRQRGVTEMLWLQEGGVRS